MRWMKFILWIILLMVVINLGFLVIDSRNGLLMRTFQRGNLGEIIPAMIGITIAGLLLFPLFVLVLGLAIASKGLVVIGVAIMIVGIIIGFLFWGGGGGGAHISGWFKSD